MERRGVGIEVGNVRCWDEWDDCELHVDRQPKSLTKFIILLASFSTSNIHIERRQVVSEHGMDEIYYESQSVPMSGALFSNQVLQNMCVYTSVDI